MFKKAVCDTFTRYIVIHVVCFIKNNDSIIIDDKILNAVKLSAVLDIVIMSVCPSITRVLCDEMKEPTADILIQPL